MSTMSEKTQALFSTTPLEDEHSSLQLLQFMGGDLDVVNAAKVSFASEVVELNESAIGILRYMMRNGHGSPFEHNFYKFRVRAPIFVAREWVRHRIGIAWNEESGRYVKLRPDFYTPVDTAMRTQKGKPGHYTFEPLANEPPVEWSPGQMANRADIADGIYQRAYSGAVAHYNDLLDVGVAKEIARAVLPVGIYTEWLWSCNARSLMHFLALRNAPTALYEIRAYAASMEEMASQIMPETIGAFREFGRKCP